MSKHLQHHIEAAQSLRSRLDSHAVQAASLIVVGRRVFGRYSVAHSVDMDPFIHLLHHCVLAWCEVEGVSQGEVDRAIAAFNDQSLRTDMTVEYSERLS